MIRVTIGCIAIGVALISTQSPAGRIKQWVDADGHITFGDAPPVSTRTRDFELRVTPVDPANPHGMLAGSSLVADKGVKSKPPAKTSSSSSHRNYSQRLHYRNAAVQGKLLVDMSPEEARRAWGEPGEIIHSGGPSVMKEQWLYDTPDGSKTIYLTNGRVTRWK